MCPRSNQDQTEWPFTKTQESVIYDTNNQVILFWLFRSKYHYTEWDKIYVDSFKKRFTDSFDQINNRRMTKMVVNSKKFYMTLWTAWNLLHFLSSENINSFSKIYDYDGNGKFESTGSFKPLIIF